MSTTFLLVRHAAHDWIGRGIAGRQPDVSLNAQGLQQARALVTRLAAAQVDAIYASPQPRTRQTVQPLAAALRLDAQVHAGFDEVDFGDWQGLTFAQLDALGEAWRHWCDRRGSAHPPGGEPFSGVPRRAMAALHEIRARHARQTVLVASHGDVIKAVVADCLGMSLDHLERIDVAPISITTLVLGDWGSKLLLLNATGTL